ncbi:MAG: PD-(D/E)XK nuclease family protein, partial [Nannocystaceae bacterium]
MGDSPTHWKLDRLPRAWSHPIVSTTPFSARVTDVGEFIRHQSCQRRFKLAHNNQALYEQLPIAKQPFHVLDPVLMAAGKRREQQWAQTLVQAGLTDLAAPRHARSADSLATSSARPEDAEIPWNEVASLLGKLDHGNEAFAREVAIDGREGAFALTGRIDFVVLLWREGKPVVRLVECKASRRDRTYHRIQVALYRLLLEQQLAANPVTLAGCPLTTIECVVARIDEANNALQPILELEPFPQVETLLADARSLLAEGGSLQRILDAELEGLCFQLDGKCDDCTFSPHCFAESARQRRLELLGATPATVRTLHQVGIQTLDDLAQATTDEPAPELLKARGGLDQHFEDLQVQARARRATLPGGLDERPVIPRPFAGKGQLPPHTVAGHRVVRVYLSVSYDYVENRIAALAAHVTKSSGELATPFTENPDGRRAPVAGLQEQHFAPASGTG